MGRGFEEAYAKWLEKHIRESTGERRRRLLKRHGFGEKLMLQQAWWPVVGSLDDLFPEYEFVDEKGSHYFMDVAVIWEPRPTSLEADGYGSHVRDIDRDDFSRGLDRQNEILLEGWHMLRFSIDKLKSDPMDCQRLVAKMLERWYGVESDIYSGQNLYQREIVRLATRARRPLSPEEAAAALGKGKRFAMKVLRSLVDAGILEASAGSERIRRYRFKK